MKWTELAAVVLATVHLQPLLPSTTLTLTRRFNRWSLCRHSLPWILIRTGHTWGATGKSKANYTMIYYAGSRGLIAEIARVLGVFTISLEGSHT